MMGDKDIMDKPTHKSNKKSSKSRKTKLTSIQLRKAIIDGLNGRWEYYCEVADGDTFANGETERGGVLIISQKWSNVVGIIGYIKGYRQWSKKKTISRKPLTQIIHWGTSSSISFTEDNAFRFSYSIIGNGKEAGKSEDVYEFDPSNGFQVSIGTFKHTTSNGKDIHGSVHIRKMKKPTDYVWAPKGIKPISE